MLRDWLPLLIAPLVFAGLYAAALDHELVWMDEVEIERGEIVVPLRGIPGAFFRTLHQPEAGGFEELRNPYYRPLQIVVVSLVHARSGAAPRPYRLVALALGFLTLLAFGAWLRGWLGATAPAVFAACFVAAHPAAIEAYAWISGLSEALGALFVVAGALAAWLCLRADGGQRLLFGALSVGALAGGLLAKEKSVVLPALTLAVALGDAAGRAAGPARWRDALRSALPLFCAQVAVVLGYVAWRSFALGAAAPLAPPIGGSPASHIASALGDWPRSLAWIFAPLHSTTSDSIELVSGLAHPLPWLGLLLGVLSLGAWVWLLRRGAGVAATGLAWLWIAFLPTANLLPQIHAHAERYLFLSCFGAALLLAEPLARALARGGALRPVAAALAVVLPLGLGALTRARLPDWRDSETLFTRDVAADPAFHEGRLQLAMSLFEAGRYREADAHLRSLLEEDPAEPTRWSRDNPIAAAQLACETRLSMGLTNSVFALERELRERDARLAQLPSVQVCLARAWERSGRRDRALAIYESVVRELPGEPPAQLSIWIARNLASSDRHAEARAWLDRAEVAPDRSPATDAELRAVRRTLRR